MKKLLSMLLVVLMMVSMFGITASAQPDGPEELDWSVNLSFVGAGVDYIDLSAEIIGIDVYEGMTAIWYHNGIAITPPMPVNSNTITMNIGEGPTLLPLQLNDYHVEITKVVQGPPIDPPIVTTPPAVYIDIQQPEALPPEVATSNTVCVSVLTVTVNQEGINNVPLPIDTSVGINLTDREGAPLNTSLISETYKTYVEVNKNLLERSNRDNLLGMSHDSGELRLSSIYINNSYVGTAPDDSFTVSLLAIDATNGIHIRANYYREYYDGYFVGYNTTHGDVDFGNHDVLTTARSITTIPVEDRGTSIVADETINGIEKVIPISEGGRGFELNGDSEGPEGVSIKVIPNLGSYANVYEMDLSQFLAVSSRTYTGPSTFYVLKEHVRDTDGVMIELEQNYGASQTRYVVDFEQIQYKVNVEVMPGQEAMGEIAEPSTASGTYTYGTELSVEASPSGNNEFDGWVVSQEDTIYNMTSSLSATDTFLVDGEVSVVEQASNLLYDDNMEITLYAKFKEKSDPTPPKPTPTYYELTISSTAGGSVPRHEGTRTYSSGTRVNMVIEAEEGYEFTGWTGDTDILSNDLLAIVSKDAAIVANFEEIVEEPEEILEDEVVPESAPAVIEDEELPQTSGLPFAFFAMAGTACVAVGTRFRKRK